MAKTEKQPSLWVSIVPIVALVAILTVAIKLFGSAALSGATQVALFAGTAICSAIAILAYHIPWKRLEESICTN
ncbi:MAG: sodium:proton antiporter, partial [Tidjanibacter sp.]|nr:sodium:proton antiporter [Tidjanibacter sp.]